MFGSTAFKPFRRLRRTLAATSPELSQPKGLSNSPDSGFTLLEVLVVVIMIAILSAIVAPGWLAFVNRQRVTKVNDAVYRALQDAQREAKRTKYKYSVSLKTDANNVPQIAIHRHDIDPDTNNLWRSLTNELEVKPELVWVGTNIGSENQVSSVSALSSQVTITFDQFGNMPSIDPETDLDVNDDGTNDGTANEGLSVIVAVPDNNNQPITSTKRCTTIVTLIGSMRTDQENDCPN